MTWAHEEFRHLDLGDKRLNDRLSRLADAFARRAEGSIPQALPRWADAKAAYRLFDNDRVGPDDILAAHAAATDERIEHERAGGRPRVLAVQDTTALDYAHHPATTGLGYIHRRDSAGLLLHATLAVGTDGLPLGLLGARMWARDPAEHGKKHERKRRAPEAKESARWADAEEDAWAVAPAGAEVVLVADREADLYALLARPRPPHAHLLIRAAHDRRVEGPADEAALLFGALAAAPVAAYTEVEVGRAGERPPRTARLAVRYRRVDVRAPDRGAGASGSVAVTAVEVVEPSPPTGEVAVHWRLLTTLPVGSGADAVEAARYYGLRWLIERFHYVLKSGCRVESLQLQTAARLERAVATLAVVAWRLLHVTALGRLRPEASSAGVLSRAEWSALCAEAEGVVPPEAPPLGEAVGMIARLGGYLGRRSDGPPGVASLWRGWRRLSDMAAIWALAHPQPPIPPLVGKA